MAAVAELVALKGVPTMFTSAAVAVLALAVALMLKRHRKAGKTQVVLMLLAGFGVGGLLGGLLSKAGGLLSHLTSTGTAKVFGIAVPAVLVVILLVELVMQMHPKNKTPHRSTMWLALLLPAVLAMSGGMWAGLGTKADSLLTNVGNSTTSFVSTLASGW
jgi:drug/metabolite transporter (DMT)-like permease